ncbi:hypothetical protein LV476_02450 [Guyparkeria hydrothermalis]|uniref:3-hydroxyacyl-ACP dehydratase FabZ family protein n=1 Tax=Guyparkeria hydrothermalis TaxID=923 RepID=UPI00202232E0|nr:hypothetical protein [Guyparkeria hydrothermalis]MCL7743814.1 hypothetical protein [Guyparkeria hydrothermalis]
MAAPSNPVQLAQWTPHADEPVFAGHFPGNPLLPGALLIDWAIAALARHTESTPEHGAIRQAKFVSPARPGAPLTVDYAVTPRGRGKLRVMARQPDKEPTLVLELLVETGCCDEPAGES